MVVSNRLAWVMYGGRRRRLRWNVWGGSAEVSGCCVQSPEKHGVARLSCKVMWVVSNLWKGDFVCEDDGDNMRRGSDLKNNGMWFYV